MAFAAIIAGDTHKSTWADSQYPASAWTLKYHLVGLSALSVDGAAQSDDSFLVTLSANQTAVLKPGLYQWAVRLTRNGEAYTVASGTVTVKPNPASGVSRVFIAQRMIELIEKALDNQLTDGDAIEATSIAGRSITMMSRLELLEERGMWYQEMESYKRALNGGPAIKSIRIDVGRL